MFTVGDFARLAQVSKRLLRYYDEIDLFKPCHIDTVSGYRFYSGEQMAQLNRILALKELGLSLDQIRAVLSDRLSTEQLEGMLLLKKAELEQQLLAEQRRLRKIENRIIAIRADEVNEPLDVIIKEVPDESAVSLRCVVEDFEAAVNVMDEIKAAIPARVRDGRFYCICYGSLHVETNLDMEFGIITDKPLTETLMLPSGATLSPRQLEGAKTMATTIVSGGLQTIHRGYDAIMRWLDEQHYSLAGTPREIVLQASALPTGDTLVTEIQFPIEATSKRSASLP